MKFKKLALMLSLFTPLYFSANIAKADEFRTNSQIETKNLIEDSDFSGFIGRVNDRIAETVKRKYQDFELSQELADFICDPEWATMGMDDVEKEHYLNSMQDELRDIIRGEARRQLKKEVKETGCRKEFKRKLKVDEGGCNKQFHIKENLGFDISVQPFSFHSFDYNPRLEMKLKTERGVAYLNAEYKLTENNLRAKLRSPLFLGCSLNIEYICDTKHGEDNLTPTIIKAINQWEVNLSYSASTEDFNEGIYWLKFSRRW